MTVIFENTQFTISYPNSIAIPGYMIVATKGEIYSLADLNQENQSNLINLLTVTHRLLNQLIKPQRIYTLSIGEIEPRLHFHIFPRTQKLLDEYQNAHNNHGQPVCGTHLFEWARIKYAATPTPNDHHINLALTKQLKDSLSSLEGA